MATTVDPSVDNTIEDPDQRAPLVLGGMDYEAVTDAVCAPWEAKAPPKIWFAILGIALSLLLMLGGCIGHLLMKGVGSLG